MKSKNIIIISSIIGIFGMFIVPTGVLFNSNSMLVIGMILESITALGLLLALWVERK